MDNEYYASDSFERRGAPRRTSQYDVLQPQFKQPGRLAAPRDRYRATQYASHSYDVVEDDNEYDHGVQLDSFGMWHLTSENSRLTLYG
jgi:hypothetical protein